VPEKSWRLQKTMKKFFGLLIAGALFSALMIGCAPKEEAAATAGTEGAGSTDAKKEEAKPATDASTPTTTTPTEAAKDAAGAAAGDAAKPAGDAAPAAPAAGEAAKPAGEAAAPAAGEAAPAAPATTEGK
jgi:hypothetical protein